MSIVVEEVSKIYGSQKALDQVSFSLKKGEVVGFLGPNGAGKSTLMKILTTYLPPSSGKASVCEHDVEASAMEVRAKVGYLPEHNPLYLEMYVLEYLDFVAGLHGLGRDRVEEMIQLTGLNREQHKTIGQLSKGYRQRVGLAQALMHNPEVLIFDEPTTGLDPNQLKEIRGLIKNIAKDKTILFSTHIMQEVEALCDRVIIINQGKIVADKATQELQKTVALGMVVIVEFEGLVEAQQLEAVKGVSAVKDLGNHRWEVRAEGDVNLKKSLFEFAVQNDLTILQQQEQTNNLETVFQSLTK